MSVRTIFEFNHDYAIEIERDPEAFVALLLRYLNSANSETADELRIRYGITRAWWGHHSTERRVVTKYEDKQL